MIFHYKSKWFSLVFRGSNVTTSDLCGISDLANKGTINPNVASIARKWSWFTHCFWFPLELTFHLGMCNVQICKKLILLGWVKMAQTVLFSSLQKAFSPARFSVRNKVSNFLLLEVQLKDFHLGMRRKLAQSPHLEAKLNNDGDHARWN